MTLEASHAAGKWPSPQGRSLDGTRRESRPAAGRLRGRQAGVAEPTETGTSRNPAGSISLVEPCRNTTGFRWQTWAKPLIFVAAAGVLLGLRLHFHDRLTLAALAGDVELWHAWRAAHPVLLPLALAAAFILITGLSIPAVITLSVLSGYLLGMWIGLAVASGAAAAGAIVAFFSSRLLLREAIAQRWPHLVARADEMVDRDGAVYLLSLRLVHVIPSWAINLVMGCTKIRLLTFWWATQVGMFPAAAVYVYIGAHLPTLARLKTEGVYSLITPEVIGAFVLLALLPLVIRTLMRREATETK